MNSPQIRTLFHQTTFEIESLFKWSIESLFKKEGNDNLTAMKISKDFIMIDQGKRAFKNFSKANFMLNLVC